VFGSEFEHIQWYRRFAGSSNAVDGCGVVGHESCAAWSRVFREVRVAGFCV